MFGLARVSCFLLLSSALAAVLVLGSSGCGAGADHGSQATPATEASGSEPATTDAPDATGVGEVDARNTGDGAMDGLGVPDASVDVQAEPSGPVSDATTLDASTVADAPNADGALASDATASLLLSIGDVAVNEGNSGTASMTFKVTLSSPAIQSVSVNYAFADDTATSSPTAIGGADFDAAEGTITFGPGETEQTLTLSVKGDSTREADETLAVLLTSPVNAGIARGKAIGTIVNDDSVPKISIQNAHVLEGTGGFTAMTFPLYLSAASAEVISVRFATRDGTATVQTRDYAPDGGLVQIPPGSTEWNVTVDVGGDAIPELSETLFVDLAEPSNATLETISAVGVIENDDGSVPALAVNDAALAEGDSGSQTMTFTVTMSEPSLEAVTVRYVTRFAGAATFGTVETGGKDYVHTFGTATFAPGETAKPIWVTTNGDVANEADDAFELVLSEPTNATIADDVGVGTIVNDDPLPSLSIANASIVEGAPPETFLVFTVKLSAISGRTVFVDFATSDLSAISGPFVGQDFIASLQTVFFSAGVTEQLVSVYIFGDSVKEADETIGASLGNPYGASITQGTAVGTIINDD